MTPPRFTGEDQFAGVELGVGLVVGVAVGLGVGDGDGEGDGDGVGVGVGVGDSQTVLNARSLAPPRPVWPTDVLTPVSASIL